MSLLCRFGASLIRHQNRIVVIGGVIKDRLLNSADEICAVDVERCRISALAINALAEFPRPLLVGVTVAPVPEDSVLLMGGSAVCFSFGTFWNSGCYTIRMVGREGSRSTDLDSRSLKAWKYLRIVSAAAGNLQDHRREAAGHQYPISVPRVRLTSADHFRQIREAAVPVVFQESDIGPCVAEWTTENLKKRVGANREVCSNYIIGRNFVDSTRSSFVSQVPSFQFTEGTAVYSSS